MKIEKGRISTNENCTGCNRCISACTVPEANVAVIENGKNKIHIDGAKCINCAMCIQACPHDARVYEDDTHRFFENLKQGKQISLLVAPALRANFQDYKRLLGLFRELGVKKIYDTSFGADICTWAYLEYIQKNNATGLISQPCPAVVNYVEKHHTEIIPLLAPIHSPAMCCAVYMKKYMNIPGEYAFISPCIAKKDEFSDPNTGNLVQYNVTYQKIMQELDARGLDYRRSAPTEFDNKKHGLGAVYSMPGGLKLNVLDKVPNAWVYQIEGQPEVKHFLDGYNQSATSERPVLVDILNCLQGCNMGTGALCRPEKDGLSVSHAMYKAEQEVVHDDTDKKKRLSKKKPDFFSTLNLDDFIRHYSDKKIIPIRITQADIDRAFASLYKDTAEKRHVDCGSCGYNSCQEMATAIAKGLNHTGNCVEYHKSVLESQQAEVSNLLDQQNKMSQHLEENVEQIFESLQMSSQETEQTVTQVEQINAEISGVQEISEKLNNMVETLRSQINEYVKLGSQIVNISTQTRLMSMNASVEAAHAKDNGKGFAVLADEMKRLSDESGANAKEILASNDMVLPMLDEVSEFSESLSNRTKTISDNTHGILNAIQAISNTERSVMDTASRIHSNIDQKSTTPPQAAGYVGYKR